MIRVNKLIKKLLRNGESGQALIMALIFLMLGSLIVAPGVKLAVTGLKFHIVVQDKVQDSYATDAGLYYALTKLGNGSGAFGPESLPSTVNGRSVTVRVEHISGPTHKITSTATYNGDNTTIESYVEAYACLYGLGAACTIGDLLVGGNGEVTSDMPGEGDVYAAGSITVKDNGIVDGDAKAVGDITIIDNGVITGTWEDHVTPLYFEVVDTSVYLDQANQGTLISGDLTIIDNPNYQLGPARITGSMLVEGNSVLKLTGTVWVDGTLTVQNNSRIEGAETIVAGSNIWLTGNALLDIDNIPLIISDQGNAVLDGNTWVSMVVYAPNGSIDLDGNIMVKGAVYAQTVIIDGNT